MIVDYSGSSARRATPAAMGKQAKPWLSPAEDPDVKVELFFAQDARDPRALGDGPCQAEHEHPLTPRATEHTYPIEYGANQWQRWASCAICGLRVGSWPKHGYTGKSNTQRNPTVVTKACLLLKAKGMPPSKKIMDALISQIEAEEKLASSRPTSTRDGGESPTAEMFTTPPTPKHSAESRRSTRTVTDFPEGLIPKHLNFEAEPPTLNRTPSQTSVHSAYSRVSSEAPPSEKDPCRRPLLVRNPPTLQREGEFA